MLSFWRTTSRDIKIQALVLSLSDIGKFLMYSFWQVIWQISDKLMTDLKLKF